ncbi:DNA polymerase III subunit gamma/tau [uncultured Eubacterium sp.]|uniref:DNA polymerase III subunit gamma/tau n=1 Tax=uncultured Eubacterium sp. TaxID=165185 RepID=UPI0025E63262|nr:DNA polymerase III subunit gamma/tau [uncultured Eubacterium sp.]
MYQVLYRKYRPKVFSDVYGQDHVTSTLKNEIKNGRVSHAYLFTGSRGTGKTTCAKILAKAVNCEHNIDGEPCNECEVCKGLDNGSIYDVVEIDAASNNGVDNIRELRDETNYAPSRGKYRVYIIDEVHMLSTGAFNALLKTLEEPPAHVIFILATTEVHKLPATILSRCQRFDFKRIQPETMAVRLKEVAGLEGLSLDDDAAVLIARIADGALRDGLSILDQCAGRSKEINSDLVSEVAGLAGREAMYKLSDCIANSDSNTAMSIISDLYQNSFDMERLCVEMINHFRNFLVAKTVRKSRELIICTDDEYNTILEASKNFTVENIVFALDLFQNTLVTIKGGASARIEVEMAFVKLCEPKMDESIASLLDRISKLENSVKNGVKVQTAPVQTQVSTPEPKAEYVPKEEAKVEPKTEQPIVPEPAVEPAPTEPEQPAKEEPPVVETPPVEHRSAPPVANPNETVEFTQWGDFMDVLHRTNIPLFGVLSGSKGYVRGEFFLLDSPNPAVRDFIKLPIHSKSIKAALLEVTGVHYKLGLFKRQTEQSAPKRDPLEDLINQAQNSINIEFK